MRSFANKLSIALAMSLAVGTAAPTMAAPVFVPNAAPAVSADVVQVQERSRYFRRDNRRGDRRDRFERRGNYAYFNGRRGYRERRRGYREYNGWWFPPAAFLGGVITGSILNDQPRVVVRPRGVSNAHVEWCYDRYRSYRASDNTFQPYEGPRRQCYSPYS